MTAQVRVPAGWVLPRAWSSPTAFDLFVLEGTLDWAAQPFGQHDYAYRPAGHPNGPLRSDAGALVLLLTYGPFAVDDPGRDDPRAILHLRLADVPPKQPLTDKVGLGYYSRTLRLDPESGERIFITGTARAGVGDPRIEWHPCVEEIYRLSGPVSMDHPDDTIILEEGAYCYRPPRIPHGPFMAPQDRSGSFIRVDTTLVNNYVAPEEACRMWATYGRDALDPLVAARLDRGR